MGAIGPLINLMIGIGSNNDVDRAAISQSTTTGTVIAL